MTEVSLLDKARDPETKKALEVNSFLEAAEIMTVRAMPCKSVDNALDRFRALFLLALTNDFNGHLNNTIGNTCNMIFKGEERIHLAPSEEDATCITNIASGFAKRVEILLSKFDWNSLGSYLQEGQKRMCDFLAKQTEDLDLDFETIAADLLFEASKEVYIGTATQEALPKGWYPDDETFNAD